MNKALLGNKIRELRVQKGLSQEQLGKLLEKSHAAISDIERGKTELTVKDLYIIAEGLGISVNILLVETEKTPSRIYSMNRFDKGVTPEEKGKADKDTKGFAELVMKLAKEKNDDK